MKMPDNENWIHRIKRKPKGLPNIIFFAILFAFVCVAGISLADSGYSEMVAAIAVVGAFLLVVILVLCVSCFSFRLYVGSYGFFYRTTPYNGRYYRYSEIAKCKTETMALNTDDIRKPASHAFFFVFTDNEGIKREIEFSPVKHGQIISVLTEKIEQY